MKKDIPINKVEDLAVAVAPRETGAENEDLWDVYLINLKDEKITDVLVNSRGYGELEGNEVKTSQFRYFFEEIEPLSIVQIEPIQPQLFELTNEYWISFMFGEYMYDKKYVFVRGSIAAYNFTQIPFLGRRGVMIR